MDLDILVLGAIPAGASGDAPARRGLGRHMAERRGLYR